jgi:hypothetical protein
MVHPYLQRREAKRADPNYRVDYPKDELREVLEKTLGVPLFQEQAMRLAMVAAEFSGAEADELRRAMAAWRRSGRIEKLHDRFVNGMTRRGYEPEFAERCFKQICGFGEYGFPESHAASFAKLVYVSAWIKRYHPAAFAAALLNSQPMGFYAPAQIVRDAREHGVEVRPVDVNFSDWDCTLEHDDGGQPPQAVQSGCHVNSWGPVHPLSPVLRGEGEGEGLRASSVDRPATSPAQMAPHPNPLPCVQGRGDRRRPARIISRPPMNIARVDALDISRVAPAITTCRRHGDCVEDSSRPP